MATRSGLAQQNGESKVDANTTGDSAAARRNARKWQAPFRTRILSICILLRSKGGSSEDFTEIFVVGGAPSRQDSNGRKTRGDNFLRIMPSKLFDAGCGTHQFVMNKSGRPRRIKPCVVFRPLLRHFSFLASKTQNGPKQRG